MKTSILALIAASAFASTAANALELTSTDIHEGQLMAKEFVYNGFGCDGGNVSPQLAWNDVPAGTKSFAITAFDPDAPTGSGWWHWSAVNIPANVTELAKGVDMEKVGALELRNDYGQHAFGGVCPPKGAGMHRYQFTVFALPTEKLELDANASPALAGFMLNSMALEKSTLTATYVN